MRALKPGVKGIYNLAGPEPMPLSRIVDVLDKSTLPIPFSLGNAMMKRLWSMHLTSFPPPELDHIRYVCMVDDKRARDVLGFRPALTIEETILSVHADR